MANSPEAAVAALEVYETLWKRSATRARPQGAPWLDGMRAPSCKRIDLIQKKARLAELLAEQPSLPVPYISPTICDWALDGVPRDSEINHRRSLD